MVDIKITAGIMFLLMAYALFRLFKRQKKLKTKEKLDHLMAAILSAIFGPIGDVWARCAFYNGALEITNIKHSCWSFLVTLPMISNFLGFWVHMNGLISDIPKKPCLDNWAIILLFLPVFLNYSMRMGGGKGVAYDKKIVLMTSVLLMALILARIYRKTTICSRIIKEEDSKFTVSYATDEALNGILLVNLLLLFMIMFCKMGGYPDIDGDLIESINATGANLWKKMNYQSNRYKGKTSNIFLTILKYIFNPALLMIFVCEFFLPGIFHGLLLSSYHLILNARMNIDNDYLKEFCTETKDIDPINFAPKLSFAYNKPWKWIGIFKFAVALVLGIMAKIIIPKMTNIKSETWFYIGGGAMFTFLLMFMILRITTLKAKKKFKD